MVNNEDFNKIMLLETNIAARYDEIALDYDANTYSVLGFTSPDVLVGETLKHINNNLEGNTNISILDFCCGTGRVGGTLFSTKGMENITLTGVDISEGMLKCANELGIYNNLICDPDYLTLCDSNVYDIIIVSGGFTGCIPLKGNIINESIDVLKVGGILVFNWRLNNNSKKFVSVVNELADKSRISYVKTSFIAFTNPGSDFTAEEINQQCYVITKLS